VEAPGRYDPAARALSFSTGISEVTSYTAVLSPDGKSLTQGKWTKSKKDRKQSGQAGMTVVSAGTWSAKLAAR
jgi:methionine-rich copper-binding protein CopC